MKGKMKKRLLSLALMVCVLMSSLTVFAAKDLVLSEEEVTSFKESAVSLIETVTAFTDEEIDSYLEQGEDFVVAAVTSWKNTKDELGAYVSVGEQTVETDGNDVVITSDVTFEQKTASVEIIADTKEAAYISMAFNVNYTMGEKMTQAGLNTIMGIGVVFLVLLFLSWLIGMFKHVSKLEKLLSGKKEAAPAPAKPAPIAAAPVEEEELSDDEELVAVIAAAIAAYEGTSTDGFVVRSIKKSNSRKWKRA